MSTSLNTTDSTQNSTLSQQQQLSIMLNLPQLYVNDYFLDLKSQVDLYFARNNFNKTVWLQIIEKINELETGCQNKLKKSHARLTLDETKPINQELLSLNRILFGNKSFIFLESQEIISLFNSEINVQAKLIIILDDWISEDSVEWLKKNELNKNNNLTHEGIKLKTLKEKLLKNSSKNDFIVEIKLDLESLTKLLLCRGIFDEASIQIEYTSIHSDAFQGMNCLQKIDLTNNAITHLDNRIFHEGLVHLEELKLGYNKIASIDQDAFQHLKNLKRLYLQNNRLVSLHVDQLKSMSKLKEVYLYSNQIVTIENGTFKDLVHLEKLSLASNRLTFLHLNLFQGLSKLKYLDLRFNKITSFDVNTFKHLENLKEFYLPYQIRYLGFNLTGKSKDPVSLNG